MGLELEPAEGDDVTHLHLSYVDQFCPQYHFDFYETEKQGQDPAA